MDGWIDSMSYLVFARKYRPQTFDAVVGQEHVTRTLVNAIDAGRVAHALLFTGPRGTGKTTVARILAKAMNCVQGPTATPCNTCRSCTEISGGHAADVFEIDGASNNSVDQVRELRENLKYMPAHSRNKIYIIDEVHMLSLAAFNALLKTLEEPPPHVLFMFATTEAHKIPVTILSRCQRHDLRRIDTIAIVDQMRRICDQEGVAIDDSGLTLVAQEAAGSMRDGLSLLDHVLTCADGTVSAELVSDLLGAAESRHLFDLADAVFSRDIQLVLEKVDTVWRLGLEMKRFYADLVVHFHQLLLVSLGDRTRQLIDLPTQVVDRMKSQVAQVPQPFLVQLLDLLFQAEPSIKLSSQPRLAMEMVFLKLFQTPPALAIETLIDRLDQLRASGGVPSPSTGRRPRAAIPATPMPMTAAASPPAQAAVSPQRVAPSIPEPTAAREPTAAEPSTAAAPEGREGQGPVDHDRLWDSAIRQVEQEKPSLAPLLKRCRMKQPNDAVLELEVSGNDFDFKSVQKHQNFLENMFSTLVGQPVQVRVTVNTQEAAGKQIEKQQVDHLKQSALSHPMVMEALELFGGKVVDVKVT
jgi:DNA polymerase III subunit gamma/tau